MRRKKSRWLLKSTLGSLILLIFFIPLYLNTPVGESDEETIVEIPPGASFRQVSNLLADKKLVSWPWLFDILAYVRGDEAKIKAGEFEVHGNWNPNELLNYLIAGKSRIYKITIPEGLRYTEITDRLVEQGLGRQERYRQLFNNRSLLAKTGWKDATTLEGMLYPETYFFTKLQTEEQILLKMVEQLNHHYPESYHKRAEELGWQDYKILIIASIIEKETGQERDRPFIAAVFHNRLKKNMRLETDPTVIYGLTDFSGNLTKKHLKTYTPYNTYRIKGLPPTPIASPGEASIHSALYPAEVDYLYFVAKGDGTTFFSSNLKTHNRAVKHYQIQKNLDQPFNTKP
ncbi:MAG: endolytic transglycosylase MltG [SAR324 cluster bacterium]|nr:endolytic transglycosylase MltG [SAR324 cluster bacterium]